MERRRPGARAAFAAPLAVLLLVAVALLALLVIEGALGELRASSASYAEARLVAAAESALAEAFARRLDSAVVSLSPTALVFESSGASADSVVTRVEVISPGVARVAISARSRNPRLRLFAGVIAFAVIRLSPTVAGEAVLRPLSPNWWVSRP